MSQPVLINFVLDKSGSMHNLQRATIEGFNSFLMDQKKQEGECKLSLTQFDTSFRVDYVGRDIGVIPMLDTMSYQPSGGTALLDAVGTTIKGAEQWIARNSSKTIHSMGVGSSMFSTTPVDWKVLVVVFTDGEENSSQEWHLNQPMKPGDDRDVGGLIQWKQQEGWEFMFLGTGGSQWLEKTFGRYVAPDRIHAYASTNHAHTHTYAGLSSSVSSTRSTGTFTTNAFNEDQSKTVDTP